MDWTPLISGARNRIAAHVVKTPTVSVQSFGLAYPVELKLEHLQHAGSFKARGAFNTLLSEPVPEAGLVAASGGNMARRLPLPRAPSVTLPRSTCPKLPGRPRST